MSSLSIEDILGKISRAETFEATAADGSFHIKISRYVPYCCVAIHDGSRMRTELLEKIALDEYERWYEEDPFTGQFISSLPITLIGADSRYEYDLNRPPESCIHEEAWGKKVWKRKLTEKEQQLSKARHARFYKVLDALVGKIESLFEGCLVYDIHSYNHERWDRQVPLFNIGAERIDQERYHKELNHWKEALSGIKVTGIENVTQINDVFFGRGYLLQHVTERFTNTLVLATEVKKVYCNELTGENYPRVIRELQHQLKHVMLEHANSFSQRNTSWEFKKASSLLHGDVDKSLLKLDKELYQKLKTFELLAYVNPVNNVSEQAKFFKSRFTELPKFKYNPIRINPYVVKQELGQLRTQDIADVNIRYLYESVISSYLDKLDMLSTLGTTKFLYNSLRYFGRPSKADLQNAKYILLLPPVPEEPKSPPTFGVEEAIPVFEKGLKAYGIQCKMELSTKVISKVMVLNSKKIVRFRQNARFTRTELKALVEHEIGIHMVTTMNSSVQRLKVLNLGLPVNTHTQEGLAILAEYLSGNLTLKRLKRLALRVIVVDMMCNGASFIECFSFLLDNGHADSKEAYGMVTRVFRGGGFTKDHLYLSGFVRLLKFYNDDNDLSPLLTGKTSIGFYDTLCEMIERKMIEPPTHITKSFVNPVELKADSTYPYLLSGLR